MSRSLAFDLVVGTVFALGLGWLFTYTASCLPDPVQIATATVLAVLSGFAWNLSAYLAVRSQARGSTTLAAWQFGSNVTNWIAASAALLTGLLTVYQNYHLHGLCG